MKLSTAIIQGLKLNYYPQCKNDLFKFDKNGGVTKCCVLGSAYLGLAKNHNLPPPDSIGSSKIYDILKRYIECKINIKYDKLPRFKNIMCFVICLNDSCNKTREQIVKILQRKGL